MDTDTIAANQRRIRQGGLMRCCLETIRTRTALTKVGDVHECNWCSSSHRVAPDGVWEWNHD